MTEVNQQMLKDLPDGVYLLDKKGNKLKIVKLTAAMKAKLEGRIDRKRGASSNSRRRKVVR